MEDLDKILKRIEERSMQELEKKYKLICEVCHKEYEDNLLNKPFFCSKDCASKHNAQEQEKRRNLHISQGLSLLPLKYQSIDTDRQPLLKESMYKNLFITGGVGTGKTVFMASLAKEYIKQLKNIQWISYPKFILKLQNSYKNEVFEVNRYDSVKVNPFDLVDDLASYAGYLFIDDLGAEKLTEFVRQTTYYLLNEREQYMLPTIITSNFSLDEIDRDIDKRVSSRICGMCKILKFTGKDRRVEA